MTDLKKLFDAMKFEARQQSAGLVSNRVLIIDGLNTFIRCWTAIPTLNEEGSHVGGMTGFLKSMGSAIRQFRPDRCIIVFDGRGGSARRKKIYPEYKGTRHTSIKLNRAYGIDELENEEQSMKLQLIKLIELLETLPVQIIALDNIEADDAIAYASDLLVNEKYKVIIMSTDKDFLQLVSNDVHVWNPIKKRYYDPASVLEDYKIHPENFLIYRTLDGDKSDNIPGVKGAGLKTLIKYFPELQNDTKLLFEDIYSKCIDDKGKPRSVLCGKILESKDIIERNVLLMNLRDVNIDGTSKSTIRNKIDSAIPILDKLRLTNLLHSGKLLSALPNLDDWIRDIFLSLNRISILRNTTNGTK